MVGKLRFIVFICVLFLYRSASAQVPDEQSINGLRQELIQLRQEYQSRIQELEQRIDAMEEQPAAQQAAADVATAGGSLGVLSNSAFNPAIGVIFSGQAWGDNNDPETIRIPGFPLGGEAGPGPEGLVLGETEMDFNANVDDKFTAWLTLPIVIEDGEVTVELEEAWIETLGLPNGFAARFGRFFSGIGYLNGKHAHAWDFVDQPLPYQALLGNQYVDDGIQVRWLAPTDLYVELGGELLRGGRYPAAGDVDSGFGGRSVFMHVGGDAGINNSWLVGLSYLHVGSDGRPSGDENDPLLFSGDSDLLIAEFVWKWSPQGNWKQKNFVLQGEYLQRSEDGDYRLPNGSVLPYDANQSGWYIQALYQPIPRWRFGARIDMLSAGDPGTLFTGTDLDPKDDDPVRFSLMTDWSNSEFSRLRLQFAHTDYGTIGDNQWGLQYIHSIGAHGAHAF